MNNLLMKSLDDRKVAIGLEIFDLGVNIKTFTTLLSLSNKNNIIECTSCTILSALSEMDERTIISHISKLKALNLIEVEELYKKNFTIKINILNAKNYGLINAATLLKLTKTLTVNQLRIYLSLCIHLNENTNKNYVYPTFNQIHTLTGMHERHIREALKELCELGVIRKKIMFDIQQRKEGKWSTTHNSLGYFIETGLDEVQEDEYKDFIAKIRRNYNNLNYTLSQKRIIVSNRIRFKMLNISDEHSYLIYEDIKEEVQEVNKIEEVTPKKIVPFPWDNHPF